jgi:DNA-binding response OmpR family regulator
MNNVNSAAKKILVIDDEGDILKLARTRLEANGYKVITLDSGENAVEFAKSEKPDIILLDIVMPGKSGYEVCKDLKFEPATCRIPVIIFTAYYPEEEDVLMKSALTCADDYLLKPFEGQALIAKIKLLIK